VTVASASVVVAAVVELLRGQSPPVLTDVAQRPAGGGWQGAAGTSVFKPYTVLWPDPGIPEGSLGDRHSDLTVGFQVTAVGQTGVQALWMQSTARNVLLGQTPTVAGRLVWPLWVEDAQFVLRDDDETPALYYATAQYKLRTGPT
jgi:hypothetical protein